MSELFRLGFIWCTGVGPSPLRSSTTPWLAIGATTFSATNVGEPWSPETSQYLDSLEQAYRASVLQGRT